MVACFFGKIGHVATVPLEHRTTVNSKWYTTKVFGEIRTTNKRITIVHHDSASSQYRLKLAPFWPFGQNVELICHPLYNPDLAPNGIFLFKHI